MKLELLWRENNINKEYLGIYDDGAIYCITIKILANDFEEAKNKFIKYLIDQDYFNEPNIIFYRDFVQVIPLFDIDVVE